MTGADLPGADLPGDVPGGGAPGPGPGWFSDPLGPSGTLRWWDGAAWSSRTVLDGAAGETVSWRPDLAALGAPEAGPNTEAPIVDPPAVTPPVLDAPIVDAPIIDRAGDGAVVEARPISFHAIGAPDTELPAIELDPVEFHAVDVVPPELPPVQEPAVGGRVEPATDDEPPGDGDAVGALDPLRAAFGEDADWRDDDTITPTPGRRRRLVPAIVAVALVAVAAGAGAGVVGQTDRPEVEPALAYRDAEAGFALRYPDTWTVERESSGTSVQFSIAAPGAAKTQTNLVTVAVGEEPAAGDDTGLPSLDALSEKVTAGLREEFPGIELEAAERTELAKAPAYRLQLVDADETPPIEIQQYVGRTTTGRPLTVNVTIREPRTAPTPAQLRAFLASIEPA